MQGRNRGAPKRGEWFAAEHARDGRFFRKPPHGKLDVAMNRRLALILALSPCLLLGCQSLSGTGQGAGSRERQASLLPLEEIQPQPVLPSTQPTTQPLPSLEALELYGRARAAMQSNQVFIAIDLLEQAARLDPQSYEVHYALGQACAATTLPPQRSLNAFSRAAELRPDSLDAWTQLGRVQLDTADAPAAIRSLRLATLTAEFAIDADRAAIADFLLARALQNAGFDRAAADRYRQLLSHLEAYPPTSRPSIEVQQLMTHPDVIFLPLAQICERLGDLEAALLAYNQAIEAAPSNFDFERRRVEILLALGRADEARTDAAAVVSRFRASEQSIQLLGTTYAKTGGQDAVIARLSEIHANNPADISIAFALSDVLAAAGRKAQAETILLGVAQSGRYDLPVVKRLYDFYSQAGRMQDAGRLMITALSARPQFINEYNSMMSQLLRMGHKQRLTLRELQDMRVDSFAESARLYWVSRVAGIWAREELSRQSLERAVRTGKPFPPAYRMLLDSYWTRSDWDEKHKLEQSEDLAHRADSEGSPALAAELRGLADMARKDVPAATAHLKAALELGGNQPDVQTAYASVQILAGRPVEAEQTLWQVVKISPLYQDAYATLLRFYMERGSLNGAMRTLKTWLAADPSNPSACLFQASLLMRSRRMDLAEKTLLELFRDNSDNTDVLLAIQSLFVEGNRLNEFVGLLEKDRAANPENREVAERLVDIYAAQRRINEAHRVLDDLRASAGKDTDLLYYLSHLYVRIDEKQTSQQVLEQVLMLDPKHVSAANDLGYYLTEEGRDLPRAEKLVRLALGDEPDNQSFLDSVGWVLYKQGRLDDAETLLRKAVGQSPYPDPVVLDHFGDVLYRLGRSPDAVVQWQRTLQRLGEVEQTRPDLSNMPLRVQLKIRQANSGQSVKVAPIPGEPVKLPSTKPAPAGIKAAPPATN